MGHEHINCEAHAHDHIHSHTHEHTHDGHTHTHPHDHEHSHDHVHPHTHDHLHEHGHEHHHDHDHHDHAAAPLKQLAALMNYMVDHNAAHANELADLAQQLKTAGKEDAYALVMSAVTDFNKGNETLAKVLKSLAD